MRFSSEKRGEGDGDWQGVREMVMQRCIIIHYYQLFISYSEENYFILCEIVHTQCRKLSIHTLSYDKKS